MPHYKAFSLIESCIVLAIITSTMMIALPSLLAAREAYLLDAAAREVGTGLQSARVLSVNRRRDCRLRVASPVTFVIECQQPRWVPVELHTMPPGFSISANQSPEFHPRGNVAPSASITVRNSRGRQKRVIVNTSGRVRTE